MQLADQDFPLTRKQVQAYINSVAAGDTLARAGDGALCLMATAYRFHHPEASVFVNYDLVHIDGEEYYLKPWQRGLMRREDRIWGAAAYSRATFEARGGLKALAKWDDQPLPEEGEEVVPFAALSSTVNGQPLYIWTKPYPPQRCRWCFIHIAQEDGFCSRLCRDSGKAAIEAEKRGLLN